jgi:hypothetical protein
MKLGGQKNMNPRKQPLILGVALAGLLLAGGLQSSGAKSAADDSKTSAPRLVLPLTSMDGLEVQGVSDAGADPVKIQSEVASYRGRRAVKLVNDDGPAGTTTGGQALAIVKTSDFKDGTIEADLAGFPREGAKPNTRGFIGIAFRLQDHGSRYEALYLRMTNGRSSDQLQRNHSTQYTSHPDFPWQRLREENPGVYESYVDLEAGAWTRIKIVVSGAKARLYVNGASQPCLIVNDLKLGETHGQVALWTGSDTEAYFSNLTIR